MTPRFDVLVVGAGPAGVAAAVTAADAGLRAGLVDDNPAAGGQIWRAGPTLPRQARRWFERLRRSRVERLQGWRVFDAPARGVVLAEKDPGAASEGAPVVALHYEKLIIATGARERFLPFPGWTLPNVMGAGGLDAMVRGGLPVAGRRVVVAGTGPLLLAVGAHLAKQGAQVVAVCEQASFAKMGRFAMRMMPHPAKLWQGAGYSLAMGIRPIRTGCWPVAALGDDRLRAVRLRQGEKEWNMDCDYLACGFHLLPNTELAALLGCRIAEGVVVTDESMQTSVADISCAGEPTGIGGADVALLEGEIAAHAAAGSPAPALIATRRRLRPFVNALRAVCTLDPRLRALPLDDTIVCRCEDVPYGALRTHRHWREAKLHTRCGMGPCQGRICGGATEFLLGWGADSVRPPIFPARVSSLAFRGDAPEDAAADATLVHMEGENR